MYRTLTILLILTIAGFIHPIKICADTYKVVAYKNCAPTYRGKNVTVGTQISDPSQLKGNWSSAKGSKYIKIMSTSDNKTHIITAPAAGSGQSTDDNFITWLWSCFSSQKKCSTRAPENELTGGLSKNMSQTFYLLYPTDQNDDSTLSFASNLENGSKLKCSFKYKDVNYQFEVPLIDNKFTFTHKDFAIPISDDDRYTIRLNVIYESPSGQQTPLTNSMNIILIPQ